MTKHAVKWLAIASIIVGSSGTSVAQDIDAGKSEFQFACATCHGIDGKEKGPVSSQLKVEPADLTVLAKKITACFHSALFTKPLTGDKRS